MAATLLGQLLRANFHSKLTCFAPRAKAFATARVYVLRIHNPFNAN